MSYRIVHHGSKAERCFTVYRETRDEAMAYWRTLMKAKRTGEHISVWDGQGRPVVIEHGKFDAAP